MFVRRHCAFPLRFYSLYNSLSLTAPISMGPWHWNNWTWFVSVMDMTALVRNANLWTDLGTIRQHRTTTKLRMYITQPISRSLPVRGIFPCPVANGIEIKRNTRHAARTASTFFGTSTTLFERWRHIASTLIEMSIRYAKTVAVLRWVVPLGLNSVTNTEDW